MSRRLSFAFSLVLVLALLLLGSKTVAGDYLYGFFIPIVSQNVSTLNHDFRVINGLFVAATCHIGDRNEFVVAIIRRWNQTDKAIRFMDNLSDHIQVAGPGERWDEWFDTHDQPLTLTVYVLDGDTASLHVWCARPTPQPPQPTPTGRIETPVPPPTPAPPPPRGEPTISPAP